MNTTTQCILAATACVLVVATRASAYEVKPNVVQKALLRSGRGKALREQVVEAYFEGVRRQDKNMIVDCFSPSGTEIRDVCGVSNTARMATAEQLGDRCMEFLAAHPDAKVMFHLKPTCLSGAECRWVFANWYETGTWSGESEGLVPDDSPLDVEGQTRFLVNDDLKIEKMVVTRTFSEWERQLQAKPK